MKRGAGTSQPAPLFCVPRVRHILLDVPAPQNELTTATR
jgi:hypothetical protein